MTTPCTVMWTYTWHLADEGIDPALDAIQQIVRCDTVSLAVAYHISTYLLPHNPRRPVYFGPDCAKQDALGNRYLTQLCPAHPDVRAYQVALTADVAANYRPDKIFVESPGYHPYDSYGAASPPVEGRRLILYPCRVGALSRDDGSAPVPAR